MLKKRNKFLFNFLLFVILIFLDQIIKIYIASSNFDYTENRLYILGLFTLSKFLYLVLVLCVAVFLIRSIVLLKDNFLKNIYILLLSGIISQSIDRLRQGYVIDYINLFDITIINLADLYIVIGVAILINYFIIKNRLNYK